MKKKKKKVGFLWGNAFNCTRATVTHNLKRTLRRYLIIYDSS